MSLEHRITAGYLRRPIPPSSTIGLDIATLGVAQDFLCTHQGDRRCLVAADPLSILW